jgi:primosomal protein N' (replication factor Y)
MALFRAEAKQVEQANEFLAAVKQLLPSERTLERFGPMPAPMPRRAGFQRTQLLLSAEQRRPLHAALDALMLQLHALPQARRVRWSLDVDPMDLY